MTTEQQIQDLLKRVAALESKSSPSIGDPFNREAGALPGKVIQDIISDQIIDIVWSKYFYFNSYFESEEGWDVVTQATPAVDGGGLNLETTNVADDRSSAAKYNNFEGVLSFDFPSRFRTNLYLTVDTTAADLDYSLSVGSGIPSTTESAYGFRVEDDELFGIARNGTTETKLKLTDINPSQGGGIEAFPQILEARFYPGYRVDFYVSNEGEFDPILRGSITTTLPSGNGALANFDLYTRTTTVKAAFVDFVEYIQQRPPVNI